MSVLIAVRVPDDLAAKMDAKGKRTQVVLAALQAFLVDDRGEAQKVERRSPKPKAASSILATPATFKDGVPDIGTVGLARLLTKRAEHDSKTCRIYKCGMCAASKG